MKTHRLVGPAFALTLLIPLTAYSQRPGRGGPPGGGPPDGIQADGGGDGAGPMGRNAGRQMEGQQQMPDPSNIAQMLMSNYDSDANGALDITELQQALLGLHQMMMSSRQSGRGMSTGGMITTDGQQGRRRGPPPRQGADGNSRLGGQLNAGRDSGARRGGGGRGGR